MTTETTQSLDALLNLRFGGRVVRKDLTRMIKEGANVPVDMIALQSQNFQRSPAMSLVLLNQRDHI